MTTNMFYFKLHISQVCVLKEMHEVVFCYRQQHDKLSMTCAGYLFLHIIDYIQNRLFKFKIKSEFHPMYYLIFKIKSTYNFRCSAKCGVCILSRWRTAGCSRSKSGFELRLGSKEHPKICLGMLDEGVGGVVEVVQNTHTSTQTPNPNTTHPRRPGFVSPVRSILFQAHHLLSPLCSYNLHKDHQVFYIVDTSMPVYGFISRATLPGSLFAKR